MAFRSSMYVGCVLCGAVVLPAFACDLPELPVIPASDRIGDQGPAISEATAAYFDGIRAYASCIQDELTAAGGEAAPESVSAVLLARASAAVAEAQIVQQLFQERVAVGQSPTPGSEEALRKLIEGLAAGTPDYDAMTTEMAETTRQQLGFLRPGASAAGAIQSIEFGGIDPEGRDIYQVNHERGITNARIALDAAGKISFAQLRPAPAPGERRPTARIAPRR